MAFMANPFDKLPFVPADGEGINPLLTHFGMFFHPPALMAGLVGISIPFAFALGALLARQTGDQWVDAGRVWGIVTWALLAGGLLLGSWWAYTILGWGGVLVLGSGGKRRLYAVAGADGVHPFDNGAEAAGDVPNVERGADFRGFRAGVVRDVYEPGRVGAIGAFLWGVQLGVGVF